MDASPLILIPARLGSTRLPGKPLADIAGLPMVGHVWMRASTANLGQVVVAAAEPAIVEAVRGLGGAAVLTDPRLPSGTDRVRAAAEMLDPGGTRPVLNVQGDMPTITTDILHAVLARLAQPGAEVVTAVALRGGVEGPERVKAVVARDGRALYFSRARVPFSADGRDAPLHLHVGVYGYARAALNAFCALPPSPLERREGLEQLRALEAGLRVDCVEVDSVPISVDTPEDLTQARAAIG